MNLITDKQRQLQVQGDAMHATHEHLVDLKNNILERLVSDASQAEEQFSVAMKSHLSHLDALIELQRSRLDGLLRTFTSDQMELEHVFSHERALIVAKHFQDKADALGILQRLEKDFGDTEADFKNEWNSMREDIKNKVSSFFLTGRIQLYPSLYLLILLPMALA